MNHANLGNNKIAVRAFQRLGGDTVFFVTEDERGPFGQVEFDLSDAFTLIDLRPLRPLVFGRRHKALDADLVRTIHGFDALLVTSGSTPSANL